MAEFKDAILAYLVEAHVLVTVREPVGREEDALSFVQARSLSVFPQPGSMLRLVGINLHGEPFSMLYHGHYYVEFKEV